MQDHDRLDDLRAHGRMHWLDGAQAWRAEPDEVMQALVAQGFEEWDQDFDLKIRPARQHIRNAQVQA